MKLPIPFLKKRKENNEYYLALLLDNEKASSVILQETLQKIKIVGKHVEKLPFPLESTPLDDLIKIVDKTISRAEEVLPPNIETHKTVFGVKENWVEEESKKIKKEYLTKLKKVCDALDLSPIGFMVISEAIANLLQTEEGAPLSAILADFGKTSVNLTLFRSGKIIESISSQIHESAPITVDNLMKGFNAPVLPTRIILFHGNDTDALAQKFMHHEWSKSLPFLHVPQITVLPPDYDSKAVAFGAANQMGFEIVGIADKVMPVEEKISHEEKIDEVIETVNEEPIIPIPPVTHPTPIKSDNFGFELDQDVAELHHKEQMHHKIEESKLEKNLEHKKPIIDGLMDNNELVTPIEHSRDVQSAEKSAKANPFAGIFANLPSIKFPKMPKLPNYFLKNKGFKLPIIVLGIILLFGLGLFSFYIYNVSAQVVLVVKPKVVTQDTNVTFSTTGASDFSKNIIAGHSVTTSIEGELSTPATGKKNTGDKAKGNVTIFNSSTESQTLSGGTAIRSSNGTTFTLDKDVSIASASGDIFTGTKPGTSQANITAKDIGPESNLPSGSKFAIGGNNALAAKNDSAFSGGSKKNITVVSKDDIVKLKADLLKSLESKAKNELSKKAQNGENVLNGFVSEIFEKSKFDKSADDEAKELKLTATVNFEGISYQNEDLENFDKSILKDHYSQDISFAEKSIKNEVKNAKVKSDKQIQAELTVTAGLLPKIDTSEVINKIKNKSPKQTMEIIGTLPQVVNSEIKYSPNIPFLPGLFQKLPNKLSAVVKPE